MFPVVLLSVFRLNTHIESKAKNQHIKRMGVLFIVSKLQFSPGIFHDVPEYYVDSGYIQYSPLNFHCYSHFVAVEISVPERSKLLRFRQLWKNVSIVVP